VVGIEAYELVHLIGCEQQIETSLCFAIQNPILLRSFQFRAQRYINETNGIVHWVSFSHRACVQLGGVIHTGESATWFCLQTY